jgi:hypothetical protein
MGPRVTLRSQGAAADEVLELLAAHGRLGGTPAA